MAMELLLLSLGLVGCSDAGDPSEEVEDTGPCGDVPHMTYANFGRGFLVEYCQGCHASTTLDRHGAPETVAFDNLEQTWDQADRILSRSLSESMPPSGGVSADDLVRLEWWLTCGEQGL